VGGFQSASFISDSPFIKFDKIIVLGVPQKLDRNVDAASELKSGSENKKGKFVPISAATSTCSTMMCKKSVSLDVKVRNYQLLQGLILQGAFHLP